jgi:hypothetical protein
MLGKEISNSVSGFLDAVSQQRELPKQATVGPDRDVLVFPNPAVHDRRALEWDSFNPEHR